MANGRTSKTGLDPQAADLADALEQMYSHPGLLLRRAHQISDAVFDQEHEGLLTPPQFSTLSLIGMLPGIDQVTVARVIGLDRTTIAVVLNNLMKQGWVTRTPDPGDGRRYLLELTDAGRAVRLESRVRANRSEKRLLSAFGPEDAQRFVDLLRRFVESFNEDSRAPVDDTALPRAQLRQRKPAPE